VYPLCFNLTDICLVMLRKFLGWLNINEMSLLFVSDYPMPFSPHFIKLPESNESDCKCLFLCYTFFYIEHIQVC